jgi:hypothetical protein
MHRVHGRVPFATVADKGGRLRVGDETGAYVRCSDDRDQKLRNELKSKASVRTAVRCFSQASYCPGASVSVLQPGIMMESQ